MKRFVAQIGISLLYLAAFLSPSSYAAGSSPKPEPVIDIKAALSALSALADCRIEGMANALAVAAQAQDAQSLEWDKVKPLLATIQKRFGPANVWFAQPDGSYFTVDKGLTDKTSRIAPISQKSWTGKLRSVNWWSAAPPAAIP
jgi:hypothetical protein